MDGLRPDAGPSEALIETIAVAVVAIVAGVLDYASTRPDTLLMGLFVDMDRMVGTQFEAGLANLEALAEK